MTNKIKFTITTAWIIFTRSYDAYCTNQFTPNLEKESNPIVTLLGMTWTPLLITIGLLTIYTIYVLYIGIFKPKNLLPTESGYTFSEITAFTYLGHKDHWTAIFYKIPKDINRFNHWMGQTLPQCLSFAGLVSTMMWLLIHHSDYYKSIHSATMIYIFLISGCIVIIYSWNKKIFKQYLSSNSK
ncbi:MAG: hypothetical protein IPH93_01010 [Saprospiraceae bacterium]|nr:hypothetical protein [Saprospiraceae bacterium]